MHTKDNQFLKLGKCWIESQIENRQNIHRNPQKTKSNNQNVLCKHDNCNKIITNIGFCTAFCPDSGEKSKNVHFIRENPGKRNYTCNVALGLL